MSRCWKIIGILIAFLCLFGCAKERYVRKDFVYWDVLDTTSTITVYLSESQDSGEINKKIHAKLTEYHQLFDAYNEYEGIQNIYTINQNAGKSEVVVAEELLDLLVFCSEEGEKIGYRTNITMGSVTQLWKKFFSVASDEYDVYGKLVTAKEYFPTEQQLSAAGEHMDPQKLILNRESSTVFLADAEMILDVGAVAKGYIAELIADYMQDELQIKSAIILLGGNTKTVGQRVGDDGRTFWTSSLINPQDPSTELQNPSTQSELKIRLDEGATLVTSGDYYRYAYVDGVRYSHLIDPDTYYPADVMSSVTVLCKDSRLADFLSTALFVMDVEQGKEILEKYDGVEVLWITSDYQMVMSDGFEEYIVK